MIERYVREGGGLLVLAETEQAKYGSNLDDLLERFGVGVESATVQDYEHNHGAPSWILAELGEGTRRRAAIRSPASGRCASIARGRLPRANGARVLGRARSSASLPGAPLILVTESGAGRVAVLADSDLFGDDCLNELDHRALWLNLCTWAARGPRPVGSEGHVAHVASLPEWVALRDCTNALGLLQAPDGALAGDADEAGRHVAAIAEALGSLRDRFEHQADYLDAAIDDLHAWSAGGFAKPDFTRSLALLRPELQRRDGIEHLVFFPMYKQNASRETCFEALIVRRAVAGLDRRARAHALREPQVRAGRARGRDPRVRQRVRRAVPRDGLRRRPSREQLRRDLLRPRVGQAAARRRRGRRPAGPGPPAGRRADAAGPRALPGGFHPLGPDPRSHPQPRRAPVRSVHDSPALALLDVLAGGAALRSDYLRRGPSSSKPRAWRSRASSATRSCSTGCCASRSQAHACATTTVWAGSCCSRTCTGAAISSGPTTV